MQRMVFYKLSSFANRQAQKTTVAKQQTNLFVFLLFLLIASFSYANPIDSKMALQVAQSFMNQKVPNADKLIWLDPIHPAGHDQLWLFNCLPQGFVLVAADDAVRPILAYSTDGQFQDKEMPAHIQSWIAGYAAEIRYLQSQHITAGSEASREWDALVDDDPFPSYTAQSVAPMLTTKWNQSPYYNSLCPYSSRAHSRAVTGCVATAMSQIMRYWSHPNRGVGSHSYYCRDFGIQSADFENTVYQWDMMPNMLTSSSTQAQMEAVATLMYHCGVAVEMGYGVDASGAYTYSSSRYYPSVNWALIDYFDYSTDIQGHSKSEYTNSGWIQMLQTELLALRPILYSGSDENGGGGHAFVCDGFNTSNQFHFNWGWGGSCDGYYVIGQLNPGGSGIGGNSTYTFNIDNEAITHIIPNSSQPGYRVSATVSDNNRGSVSGAGTYLEGDTVTLLATAQQGYRFVEWTIDDQSFQNNPFLFIVEDNYNFEARFATIGSDTIQYDNGKFRNRLWVNGGASLSYAMRIDPQNLRENTCLVSAMVFDISAGSHTLKVYQGENPSSAQLLATKSFTLSGDSVWRSVTFADSIPITTTQPLWLVVSAANAAAPCASYAGFDDGSWLLNADGQWQTVTDQDYYLTWMLREVFARRNSQAQCHITQFPYLQDFEYDMSCWTSAVADRSSANLLGMGVLEAGSQAYSADYVYQFCSYFSSNDYRQYLISPQLSASGDINLTFYCWAPYGLYYAEQFRVLYSTESNAVEDFVYQVADVTIRSSSWHKCNFTIPATARYIAIQYYSQYKYYLMVDDIQLTTAAPNILSQLCQIDTLPWVENFYDSDTKACWQSVDNDRDGYDWMLETYPNLNLGVVFSESYVNRKGALQPDNWLISPSIVLPAGHSYKLSWYAAGVDDNDYAEHYSVYLSTQGYGMPQLISNPIFSHTITRPDWEYHEVDLSPYAGNTIVLNFRHHNCSNQYRLWITDVSIQSTDDTLAVIAPQTDGNHYPLIVAPNPATDVVTIYTQGFQSAQLFDLHARCRLVSNSESFSTAHLPRGVYMLRVTTQYGVQIRKVILTSH